MFSLACAVLAVSAAPEAPSPVVATTYHHTFSRAHPVLKHIRRGETVVTRTIDAAGLDENGEAKAERGNPLTGPFSIEGAEPGDALAIHIKKLRFNRDWGYTLYRLGLFALTPEAVEHIYPNHYKPDVVIKGRANVVRWDIDKTRGTVRLRAPVS